MKNKLETKKEQPQFNFLVKQTGENDYYLYDDFDKALTKAKNWSIISNSIVEVLEVEFIPTNREYRCVSRFRAFSGKLTYHKHETPLLHAKWYVEAGTWLNPQGDE